MKVFIVDDHELIRTALRRELESHGHRVVAEAKNLSEANAFLNQQSIDPLDLAIVDLSLPDGSGLELIRSYAKAMTQCHFILLTANDDEDLLHEARSAGASAYVNKAEPLAHLLRVIEQRASSLDYLKLRRVQHYVPTLLSEREEEVLGLVASGFRSAEIASHLFIAESTVKSHLAAINRKLGTTNRTMAIARARALNLL